MLDLEGRRKADRGPAERGYLWTHLGELEAMRGCFGVAREHLRQAEMAHRGFAQTFALSTVWPRSANVVIEAMKRADSVDPAKFTPEIYKLRLTGATGKIEFDAKGDRKDADMTIFRMQSGQIVPVAIVKGGVMTPFR